jgi:hypothetical protein
MIGPRQLCLCKVSEIVVKMKGTPAAFGTSDALTFRLGTDARPLQIAEN